VIVVLATVASLAAVWILTETFAARTDGTVLVDDPDHPGEAFCEGPLGENESDCEQLPDVERDIDAAIHEARGRLFGSLFLAVPVGRLFVGLLLHAGSRLAGGEGGVGDSFAVAAWGMIPGVVALAVGPAVLRLTFDPVTVTPGTERGRSGPPERSWASPRRRRAGTSTSGGWPPRAGSSPRERSPPRRSSPCSSWSRCWGDAGSGPVDGPTAGFCPPASTGRYDPLGRGDSPAARRG